MANVAYKVVYSHGVTTPAYDTYEEAVEAVRSVYTDPEIGHDGDISEGGDRTLVWTDEDTARGDDGSRAVASIRKVEVVS